jgi:hypothetical protein
MCREFDPEFATVAHSWRKAHPTLDGVFFAKLDFADGRPIFMRVFPLRHEISNLSLVFNLRRMYGYTLQPAALFRNSRQIINPSFTISPESRI